MRRLNPCRCLTSLLKEGMGTLHHSTPGRMLFICILTGAEFLTTAQCEGGLQAASGQTSCAV